MPLNYDHFGLSHTFPKIAVLCGAHTPLGQQLLRDLVHSVEIDKVHAITSMDIPLLRTLPRPLSRKVTLHKVDFDTVSRALAAIPECDIAFCCLSTDKHAYGTIGHTHFKTLNYEAPRRFVDRMFELGVLYIGIVSHERADCDSRTELYKLRGDLEEGVRVLRREAGDFSPFLSLFKVQGGNREVATAMRVDALLKSARRKNVNSGKRRAKYEEMDWEDVERLVREDRRGDEVEGRGW